MRENKNWNLGEEIQNIVQDAVNTMDFKKLNTEITTSVNSALAEVRNALGISVRGDLRKGDAPKPGTWRPVNNTDQGDQNTENNNQDRMQQKQGGQSGNPDSSWRNWAQQRPVNNRSQSSYLQEQNQQSRLVRKVQRIPYVPVGKVKGALTTVFGWLGSLGFGITVFVFCMISISMGFTDPQIAYLIMGFLPPFAVSLLVAHRGSVLRARLRRMKIYLKQLQHHGFASVKELSGATGFHERFIVKDLKRMLSIGMFPEGQFDRNETCFMATRSSYEQYYLTQQGYEQRQLEEKHRLLEEQERLLRQNMELKSKIENKAPQTPDPYAALAPEVRAAIELGRNYIDKIKKANEAIEGEEISAKLDRLELVIDRILYHVEKHPAQLSEIRRFMEYYLPTTLKLVNAYQNFDSQPLQGENITTAKEEIQKSLDTLNIAFEKLLDSMFEDAAMDVSTDISVLETMLAQEGLKEHDFSQEEIKLKL